MVVRFFNDKDSSVIIFCSRFLIMLLENGVYMHSLIDIFAYKVYKERLLSHRDLRKMKYAMTVVWNEVIKLAALLALFFMLNKTYEFLFCFSILLSIRTFSGGLHFE